VDPVGSLRRAAGNAEMASQFGLVLKPGGIAEPSLLDPTRAFESFVGREQTISPLLRFFQGKFDLLGNVRSGTAKQSKEIMVHAATCGAPGVGAFVLPLFFFQFPINFKISPPLFLFSTHRQKSPSR